MGQLHDALKASGYEGHDLERLLVRLVFCLFAELANPSRDVHAVSRHPDHMQLDCI
jgi:hypothetical protein